MFLISKLPRSLYSVRYSTPPLSPTHPYTLRAIVLSRFIRQTSDLRPQTWTPRPASHLHACAEAISARTGPCLLRPGESKDVERSNDILFQNAVYGKNNQDPIPGSPMLGPSIESSFTFARIAENRQTHRLQHQSESQTEPSRKTFSSDDQVSLRSSQQEVVGTMGSIDYITERVERWT
ncbi:hypothetical protein PoB_006826200 [Plakobranchus ocellatus]|uniref:Uncharacterized protein n=1 Tax=Plakobranchus ocellatus TaxID=259542 RepID=A0AAV4DC12_9GAST|nr:hypothetical protein PoB_006826200 [Plakobranchus ocellatus]